MDSDPQIGTSKEENFVKTDSDTQSDLNDLRSISFSSSSSGEEDLIVKAGWLRKKSTHLIKRWQWRYFVLKDHVLFYYNNDHDQQPRATINFNQITVDINVDNPETPQELVLKPLGSKRVFRLKGNTAGEIKEWVDALKKHIKTSEGFKQQKYMVTIKKEFWRYPRISHDRFRDIVQTGDVLLFRSKSIPAKMQRAVTGSKYDHVAFLLKLQDEQVALLESTSQTGVQVLLWEDFMRYQWHLLYTRLVYRKLNIERTDQFLDSTAEFLTEVSGKKYRLAKAIFKKSKGLEPGSEEGYFCSELVACAYKKLNLLGDKIHPSRIWPGNFSTEKPLELTGCSLGPEILIDFELGFEE
ncbi:unnamed protein product [Blepharisma stoltei]|uniref:PH domain-containing protein n=1 Tax=Blepharisma stoltei TaxID=1481888 RepID=A0AAU9IYB4_9CILI|nr:unnamed protein product [Blepharisma stoltei]